MAHPLASSSTITDEPTVFTHDFMSGSCLVHW